MYTRVKNILLSICLLLSAFSYAQTQHVSLGANYSNAVNITDTTTVSVTDGTENYFKIEAAHLPASVFYMPDTAFGPIPMLISTMDDDTLTAVMVSENCHMGWRWELPAAGEEETVHYFYFSSHEHASAEIRPYIFTCPVYDITLPDTAVCEQYVWKHAGNDSTIEDSGTYTRHFVAVNGCDSVVTQRVTINEISTTHLHVTAYDQYVWHVPDPMIPDQIIKSNYIGVWEGTNVAGCDSIVNLFVTIRHLCTDTVRQTICSSQTPFVWRGMSLEQSGIYSTDTIPGPEVEKVYRDTVHILVLTVNQAYAVDTTASACDSYVWRGQTYSESGNYPYHGQTKAGCDSLVTLHLTINHAAASDTTASACGSFVWHGQTYSESGDYPYHGQTKAGCDSLVTLRLTIHNATAGEETRSEYNSYTWNGTTYTQSGDYTYHTTNIFGCDSTATLHLTILIAAVSYDTVYFCAGMNTEHEELLDPAHIRRYLAYTYESPDEWDYMEGVILAREHDRMQVDLRRAEQNLMNHYVDRLTPVKSIVWSYRPEDSSVYQPLEVTAASQWIPTGTIAVAIRFVCGQLFVSDFATDLQTVTDGESNGRKVLENGQIIIIRGGHKYTLLGTKID